MFENRNKKRTEISELGEFGLIDHLASRIQLHHPETIKGVGDDAAVIDTGANLTLISKDLLLEDIHFDLSYHPLKHLGYKAIAVNLSDIYAMNGIPKQVIVGLGLSSRFPLEAIEELYEGMILACNKYKVDFVGGDTTSSKQGLILSVTVVGEVKKEHVVYRGPAAESDLLCVSGDLGAAYAGLLILEREKTVFKADPNMQPDLHGKDYLLERFLKPEPREDVIQLLQKLNIKPTAMIDVSDGLASEIKHICKHSELGCTVYEDKIPIDQLTYDTALDFNMDPTLYALNGGEDYELLFTIKQADFIKLKELDGISVIGHMADKNSGINLVTKSGPVVEIKAQGWDHLKESE
nr:thiamine-phosphate kinase [Bacteroidota bacterium]